MLWYALCLCYALLSPYACPVHTFAHCNCCVWCLQNTKHSALTWFSSTILIIVILCSPFTRKSSRHSASVDEWKCSFMQTIRIYLIASVSCFAQKIQQSCWWICVACVSVFVRLIAIDISNFIHGVWFNLFCCFQLVGATVIYLIVCHWFFIGAIVAGVRTLCVLVWHATICCTALLQTFENPSWSLAQSIKDTHISPTKPLR